MLPCENLQVRIPHVQSEQDRVCGKYLDLFEYQDHEAA